MKLIALILSFIILQSVFSQSADTLYPVSVFIQDSYKYGYINREGYLSIKPQYAFVKDFSEGLAFVKNDNKSGKWLCINTAGKVEFELIAVYVKEFRNGLAHFIDSLDGKYFVNRSGKVVNDPLEYKPEEDAGIKPFSKEGKWGYEKDGSLEILPPIYENAGSFSEGMAPVFIKFKDSDLPDDENCYNAFINEKGDVVLKTELKYDENGYLVTGYYYKPGRWLNGVCSFYTSMNPRANEQKYIRNDGKIIW